MNSSDPQTPTRITGEPKRVMPSNKLQGVEKTSSNLIRVRRAIILSSKVETTEKSLNHSHPIRPKA
jgi:hypothetical protein